MALQLIEHADPRDFRDAVMGRLMESEAENCAHIGLVERIAQTAYAPISTDELDHPVLLTIQEDQRVEAMALQTLKRRMLVSRGSEEAMHCLAEGLVSRNWDGDGIVGPTPAIEALTKRYAGLSDRPRRLSIRLRAFQLSSVTWPQPVSGSMRVCTHSDRSLLGQFISGFVADVGETSTEESLATADRLLRDQRIFFWVDQEPVAMASWAGRTPNGVRINFVYTPPVFRRRGYASNLVAHLTQRMLDEGRKFCFLFTDQANPTSNRIYQQIGYTAVGDSERWDFETPVKK
jgi:uncharacterized protein